MGNSYNIKVGEKFGKLTVIDIIREEKHIYYKCICECGKITKKQATQLTKIDNITCGCESRSYIKDNQNKIIKEYTGKTIEKIKILQFVPKPDKNKSKDNGLWVKCLCYCGNEFITRFSPIKTGAIKSCGHDRKKILALGKEILRENSVEGTNLKSIQQKISKNNKTGVKGVSPIHLKSGITRYRAYINLRRKQIPLGTFDTLEEAEKARKEAEHKYYDEILERYQNINGK